jgi:hypothetical protein
MSEKFTTRAMSQLMDKNHTPLPITVNDRAATRSTIFRRITAAGFPAIERSDWAAHKINTELKSDWDYSMIAIHHAGRSYSCNPGSLQMKDIQEDHQAADWGDIGYHYGIDCSGFIFEGRDIRHKGNHLEKFNTGAIGIVLLANLTAVEEGEDFIADIRVSAKEKLEYDTTQIIPPRQIDALLSLLAVLKSVFNITVLGGHTEYPLQDRICPGNVGMELVRVLRVKTNLLPPPAP